jgi:hypothetical protein
MGSEGCRTAGKRLEEAVEELRRRIGLDRLVRPAAWQVLEAWDEAVAEGERPALVGEDAEAPVAVGPTDMFCRPERTDKFGVAPSDAPCPVPPKPEPDCCTDDEDLFDEEDNEPWGLDAMDDIETLREGLADLKKRFEKHIGL